VESKSPQKHKEKSRKEKASSPQKKSQKNVQSPLRKSQPSPTKKDKDADHKRPVASHEEPAEVPKEEIKILDTDLIPSLKEDTNFLTARYNEKLQEEKRKKEEEEKRRALAQDAQKQQQNSGEAEPKPAPRVFRNEAVGRAGGVYIPPFKLQLLQQEILEKEKKGSKEHQRLMWELLRKSINGIINKVNVTNIQNVIIELLNENLLRGKGLLTRAIIKGQMASPNFTHVYVGLISVINTKLPEIAYLIIKRVVLQFRRAYKRNNKVNINENSDNIIIVRMIYLFYYRSFVWPPRKCWLI
jgi:hypothetical protein